MLPIILFNKRICEGFFGQNCVVWQRPFKVQFLICSVMRKKSFILPFYYLRFSIAYLLKKTSLEIEGNERDKFWQRKNWEFFFVWMRCNLYPRTEIQALLLIEKCQNYLWGGIFKILYAERHLWPSYHPTPVLFPAKITRELFSCPSKC